MRRYFSRWLLGIAITLNLVISAQAQMAQVPIMTQSSAAEPNLVFVFDNSGSMDESQMYQFGKDKDWDAWGRKNPETGYSVQNSNRGSYASYSPDVNLMYYDPRILYQRQVDSRGVPLAAGSTGNIAPFNVYFCNGTCSPTLHVDSVPIPNPCGSGYSTTIPTTVTFQPKFPTAGVVQATGTVTVGTTGNRRGKVTGITITNPGSGYTSKLLNFIYTPTPTTSCKPTPSMPPDASTSVTNKRWNGAGPVSSLANYFSGGSPAGYLPDAGSPLATGADATVQYPNAASILVPKYPKFAARTDCAGNYCTWTEELQNYANWNLYHSTRVKLARTGISLALKAFPPYFNGNELPASFRLGWGTIRDIASSSNLDAGVSLFTQARKDAFYTWLTGPKTNSNGGTPNRLAMDRVGQYYSRYDSDGPWGTNPKFESVSTSANTTTPGETQASCRRSNMLLLTDGYWNDGSSGLGNIDNTAGPTITPASGTSYKYIPSAPKKDDVSDTLADVAMKYWVNDLRPDLANNVKPPIGLTYPTWQNVSFYGIGLGVYGTLEQSGSVLASLTAGTLSWPNAVADSPTAIDDMWHAAVNSGGSFLSAGDSDALTSSIEQMLASINKINATGTGVAVSTGQIDVDTGARIFKPSYWTGSWTGNIEAYDLDPVTLQPKLTLDPVTGLLTKIPTWQVVVKDPVTGDIVSSTIPPAADRHIVVGNGASSSPKAIDFTYSAMSAASLTSLMTGTVNDQLIDYLRGDTSNEGTGTANFRVREASLGDIVNSRPVFVKGSVDLLYDAAGSSVPGASSYRSYVDLKKARTEGVLFVGANDGMLHAFRDGATSGDPVSGEEIFAYVPKAVLPNLSSLAHQKYGQTTFPHKYFVDGRLVETDVFLGAAWANVVVGTTGAGGKSVFALQVPTDPLTISGTNLLWEVSSDTAGFGELGYILSDVQTGVLPTGEWVAIFGNGYFSAAGSAQLFVVNLQTGALIQKIDTLSGPNNGLSGVTLVLDSSTKRVIGAYAGDIKGNLWKFDLSSTSTASGFVGLSGVPLLAVGSTQAITTAPTLVNHPSGGYVVSVATGKLFELGDVNTTGLQRVYGVWDSVPFGSTTTPSGVAQTGITNLVGGIWTDRTDKSTTIDWTCKRGWYVDMNRDPKQRNIYPMNGPLTDNSLIVASMSPSNLVTSACNESATTPGWRTRILATSNSCTAQPDPSVPVPVLPVCHGADCACGSNSAGGACTCTGSDCCIGPNCSGSGNLPPNDDKDKDCGEITLVKIGGCTAGIQKYLEVTPMCSPKNIEAPCPIPSSSSVKRQWRQLFMR